MNVNYFLPPPLPPSLIPLYPYGPYFYFLGNFSISVFDLQGGKTKNSPKFPQIWSSFRKDKKNISTFSE